MKVYIIINFQGQIKGVYLNKKRAKEDLKYFRHQTGQWMDIEEYTAIGD